MSKNSEINPAILKLMDYYKRRIYDAAVLYKNSELYGKDKIENNEVFMISKKYIDNFKDKINYNNVNELFSKNTEDNYEKFSKVLDKYELNELEGIIFLEIQMFGELEDLEDNINKGFDFISKEFLEALEYEIIHENDYKVKYIKDTNNNIIIIFNDDSKLLIFQNGNDIKYHAIPAPVKPTKKKPIKRAKTIFIKHKKKEIEEIDN